MNYFEPGTYRIQSANESWSYWTDDNRMRFELRSQDHWQDDEPNKERSEIASYKKLEFGQPYTVSYKFMVEPGQANTAQWLVIGQLHATEDSYDDGVSPPVEITLVRERMSVNVRWSDSAVTNWGNVQTTDNPLYLDTQNIQRGRWYDIKMTVKFDSAGQGMLDVWRDGVQLVDYTGPLGYNDQIGPYWKHGVYRAPSNETIAVNYSNFALVKGTVMDQPTTHPTPTGPVTGTPGGDTPHNAETQDTILLGTARTDILRGTGRQDKIFGSYGSDKLYGEAGNDTLDGGIGKDVLTGGAGQDVFMFDTRPSKKANFDTIRDFSVKDDSLWLDNKVFLKLGRNGSETNPSQLKKSFFTIGDKAKDGNDYLIYNKQTKVLSYDVDGSGAKQAIEIAKLSKNLKLTAKDFFVI